jgi:hypothetical protein
VSTLQRVDVTLHRKVDSDVSAVCADAGDDTDGVVIDGAPFVLGSRHAPLHAHPIADLFKSNFFIRTLRMESRNPQRYDCLTLIE